MFRVEGEVRATNGQAIAGAQAWICTQPADTSGIPPSSLATVYADAAGTQVVSQPLITDSLGAYAGYADSGLYTLVVFGNGQKQIFADQGVGVGITPVYYRKDLWIKDALGRALSGTQVFVCQQPANTNSSGQKGWTPSPLQSLFSDSSGGTLLPQPLACDGFGHVAFYAIPGIYTIAVTLGSKVLLTIPDTTVE